MDTSVRPPRVLTRSFPLMTVPYTAGAPCSYWTLTCLAVSSALHSLMGFLFVSPVVCLQLPSDSISRWTPLLFGYPLPTAGRGRAFHPLERAPAGRTNEIKHAARVLSRYRDARRTRILRIRLRLTVRVKKDLCSIRQRSPESNAFYSLLLFSFHLLRLRKTKLQTETRCCFSQRKMQSRTINPWQAASSSVLCSRT